MSNNIQIGSKVMVRKGCVFYSKCSENLKGSIGVVYARPQAGQFYVRFQDCPTTFVCAHGTELKEIGLIDDLQEVKSLATSWGANPFDSCWEGKPYV